MQRSKIKNQKFGAASRTTIKRYRRRRIRNFDFYISIFSIFTLSSWTTEVLAVSIPIQNASFEAPLVEAGGFSAVPFVDGWTEIDVDTETSTNTGVFANPTEGSPDRLINADGNQLAFLGSQAGNALEQDLIDTYRIGCEYTLTAAVGISGMFGPSVVEPVDALELVLYYRDGEQIVDLAAQTVEATGLSSTELKDFTLQMPHVLADDDWAGRTIGVALRAIGMPGGFWDIDNVRLTESSSALIKIENASFEAPVVDPNGFVAVPYVDVWTELDLDAETSTNTGVFVNPAEGSPGRVSNAEGDQLAFLGSETGNALEQDLSDTYKPGREYKLTVAVGVSGLFPPSMVDPVDMLELVLYYYGDANEPVDIASKTVEATGFSSIELKDFSLYLPSVQPNADYAAKKIGVALRSVGMPGGFWDLDDVQLIETVPKSVTIENASFESPVVDPNGFLAVPFVDGWTELDLDAEMSTNTGVFLNLPEGSPGNVAGADGDQLAFLGSETGNALEQEPVDIYNVGCEYRLSAAVGVSGLFPPAMTEPVDKLELVLYYVDESNLVDIVIRQVEASGLSSTELMTFELYLPAVQTGDAWAGKPIGVALRSAGMPGGFWDIDDVRLIESQVVPDP